MFDGYFVKFGRSELPAKYMNESSYDATPKQRQDLDSYRDNTGVLHRTVVNNQPSKVVFKTLEGLTNSQMKEITSLIEDSFSVDAERKSKVTFYDPWSDSYITEDMYVPDVKFQIDYADKQTNTVYYKAISFTLIGY